MLIRILAGVAVALAATAPLSAKEKPSDPPKRVRSSCIGDRCAIYVNGYRVGSVRTDERRLVIRDKRGRVVARVRQTEE